MASNVCVCMNPVQWIKDGFGHQSWICQLSSSMDEMFPSPILNHRIVPTWVEDVVDSDPESIIMVQAHGNGDLVNDVDFKYRTMVSFLDAV